MASIFKRISDVVTANINDLMDRFEHCRNRRVPIPSPAPEHANESRARHKVNQGR
jgi:hypothetical protein